MPVAKHHRQQSCALLRFWWIRSHFPSVRSSHRCKRSLRDEDNSENGAEALDRRQLLAKGGGNCVSPTMESRSFKRLYHLGKRGTPRRPEHNFAVNPCFPEDLQGEHDGPWEVPRKDDAAFASDFGVTKSRATRAQAEKTRKTTPAVFSDPNTETNGESESAKTPLMLASYRRWSQFRFRGKRPFARSNFDSDCVRKSVCRLRNGPHLSGCRTNTPPRPPQCCPATSVDRSWQWIPVIQLISAN